MTVHVSHDAVLGRLWRALRSRRLAVWLLLAVAGYALGGTFLPRGAYSRPPFLALLGLLALSTGACAWERTRSAAKAWRASGRVTEAAARRLRERPALALPAPDRDPLAGAEQALRRLRLRVRRGPALLEASAGRLGLLGSPVFHWSLAALFVVVAFGQLTRSEGTLGVPLGGSRTDEAPSYAKLSAGPLHAGGTGIRIAAEDFTFNYRAANGFDYGPSPRVALYEGDRRLASQWVYPNAPLRHGPLLVHFVDYGLASWVSVLDPTGAVAEEAQLMHDFDTSSETGTTEAGISVDFGGTTADIRISPVAGSEQRHGQRFMLKRVPAEPRLAAAVESSGSRDATLAPGDTLALPGGYRLRFDRVTLYARLTVADDWSVPVIYALFGIAALSLALAVFVPFRTVRVLLAEDGKRLHAEWRHSRRDAAFEEAVTNSLRVAAGETDDGVRDAATTCSTSQDAVADGERNAEGEHEESA